MIMYQVANSLKKQWLTMLMLSVFALPSLAAGGVPWKSLSDAEQKVLSSKSQEWASLSPRQQQDLQQGAQRWSTMSEDERQAVRKRYQTWQQMPDEEKQQIRERYRKFSQLDEEKQQQIRAQREEYRSLPQERRRELRQRWQAMMQKQRQSEQQAINIEADESGSISTSEAQKEETIVAKPEATVPNGSSSEMETRSSVPRSSSGSRTERRIIDRMPRGTH